MRVLEWIIGEQYGSRWRGKKCWYWCFYAWVDWFESLYHSYVHYIHPYTLSNMLSTIWHHLQHHPTLPLDAVSVKRTVYSCDAEPSIRSSKWVDGTILTPDSNSTYAIYPCRSKMWSDRPYLQRITSSGFSRPFLNHLAPFYVHSTCLVEVMEVRYSGVNLVVRNTTLGEYTEAVGWHTHISSTHYITSIFTPYITEDLCDDIFNHFLSSRLQLGNVPTSFFRHNQNSWMC